MDTENATATINDVRIRGRLSAEPECRVLPSGDEVWTFRVVVDRPRARGDGRRAVDTIDCAAWTARTRRSVRVWSPGDTVEVSGAIRRRFYRTPGGASQSRVEIEMVSGRLARRARSA